MENSDEKVKENGQAENGHIIMKQSPHQPSIKVSLPWLDVRVFYVRVSKCEIDDSIPEYLTMEHIPLKRDTLLEVNGVRTSIYSNGVSIVLRRDRLDKKSEEVTFVSTNGIRTTGSVKFEVFDKDVIVLSGALHLCNCNGFNEESENYDHIWYMNCEAGIITGKSFFKAKQYMGQELSLTEIEVYVAGCFMGNPIILTKTLDLGFRRKQMRKGMLESIPEYEATESEKNVPTGLALQARNYKPGQEEYNNFYSGGAHYLESEDGEVSWFNAGVRVGVGIGLSMCLGIGIGMGLLVRTYQGTTRNFRRRLL